MEENKKKFFNELIKEASEQYIKDKGIVGVNSILAKKDFVAGAEFLYNKIYNIKLQYEIN